MGRYFLVDLIVFVKYFKFSPVLSEKRMHAHSKKNPHSKVVGTPRIFHNKGIQPFKRLAHDGDPQPEFPV